MSRPIVVRDDDDMEEMAFKLDAPRPSGFEHITEDEERRIRVYMRRCSQCFQMYFGRDLPEIPSWMFSEGVIPMYYVCADDFMWININGWWRVWVSGKVESFIDAHAR